MTRRDLFGWVVGLIPFMKNWSIRSAKGINPWKKKIEFFPVRMKDFYVS